MVLPIASAPGYLLQGLRPCSSTTCGYIGSHPPQVNSCGENSATAEGRRSSLMVHIHMNTYKHKANNTHVLLNVVCLIF